MRMALLLGTLSLASSSLLACSSSQDPPANLGDVCGADLPGAGSIDRIAATGDRVYVSGSIELHVLEGSAGACPTYRGTYLLDQASSGSMVASEHVVYLAAAD